MCEMRRADGDCMALSLEASQLVILTLSVRKKVKADTFSLFDMRLSRRYRMGAKYICVFENGQSKGTKCTP